LIAPLSAAQGAQELRVAPSGAVTTAASAPNAPQEIPAGRSVLSLGAVAQAWFDEAQLPRARAIAGRRAALEVGLHEAGGPARALVAPALRGGGLAEAQLAVKLAADLPLVHMALASVYWRDGEYGAALEATAEAVAAVPANLEATLWLADTLLVLLTGVLLWGSLAFIALVGLRFFGAAAHDLGDAISASMPGFARVALLASGVLAPWALGEGPLGSVLVLFAVGFLYGATRHRSVLALAASLSILAMVPVARTAGRVLEMSTADPVASAVLAVRQGVQDPGDIALLERAAGRDALAAHALAAHARQRGQNQEAFERYRALADVLPTDPVVANNLASLYFRAGDLEEAVAGYERAARSVDSPVVAFNLSQAFARGFQIESVEAALRHAQRIGGPLVHELSQHNDPEFVADLPIPLATLRSRMFAASDGHAFGRSLRAPIAPGWLGVDWPLPAAAFAIVGLLASLWRQRFEPSAACRRCGVRVCARCDAADERDGLCDGCDHLFRHPEQTDSTLRAARLEQLGRRELRRRRSLHAASLVLPGFGGLATERPEGSLLALLSFGWVAAGLWLCAGVVPDPLVMGAAGPLLIGATVAVAAMLYAGGVLRSIRRLRSR